MEYDRIRYDIHILRYDFFRYDIFEYYISYK